LVYDGIVNYNVIYQPGIHDAGPKARIVCFEPDHRLLEVSHDIKINDSITIVSLRIVYSIKEEVIPDLFSKHGVTDYLKRGFESDFLLGRYFDRLFTEVLPSKIQEKYENLQVKNYDDEGAIAIFGCLDELMEHDGLVLESHDISYKSMS